VIRIAWFSAFSGHSGIADFSRHVASALASRADVDIWTADDPPLLESDLRVVGFGEGELQAPLAGYDFLVYNMGNTLRSHRLIHQVSKRHPGVVILHDRVLHPMFVASWRHDGGFIDPTYVARMEAYYGEPGALAARDSISGARPPVWESDEVVRFPLTEEALQGARGVVTHSQAHAEWIRERWAGPVRDLRLPAYRSALSRGELAGFAPVGRRDGRLQLTTIGHVTANKQCHRVLRLLADDPGLAKKVHYTIAGPLDPGNSYADELKELLQTLPHVSAEVLGEVSDENLESLMTATDVFVNLRQPVFEGGSASLMLEFAFGRAVLCFDDGAFGELPHEAVARVPAGDFGAVHAELRRLVGDAGRRRVLAENARRVAVERSEDAYARSFIEFLAEVERAAPALALIDRIGLELGALGADPRLAIFDSLAGEINRLVCS